MRISDWSSDVCSADLAEVALAVDQRIAVRERLRHQHHRLVAGGVAVRVELADHVADGARRLLRLGRRTEPQLAHRVDDPPLRSEEHTSELQSLMRISYAVFCLKKQKTNRTNHTYHN